MTTVTVMGPDSSAGLPATAELRRDRPLPVEVEKALGKFWSGYLDDFDAGEIGAWDELSRKLGEVDEWQECVRAAYAFWGVPRGEGKEVLKTFKAERLGALIDGAVGKITGTPKKLLQTLSLVNFVLRQREVDKTLVEMCSGRLIHRMQFRRPTMGALTRIWKYLRRWGLRRPMPLEVEEDLLVSVALLPLMCTDLRWPVSKLVTCSDASEVGNGACASGELTQ